MVVKKFNRQSVFSHIVLFILQFTFWEFVSDDAFISFRYAKNMVFNLELTYNLGNAPVEGYESFLWLLWLAIGFLMRMDILLYAKLSGMLFCHLSVYILHNIAFRLSKKRKFANWITLIFVFTPTISLWSVSGAYYLFYLFILLASLYTLLADLERASPFWYIRSSIAFVILSLSHTLSIFICIFTIIFSIYYLFKVRKVKMGFIFSMGFMYGSLLLAIYLPYVLWRIYYYDSIIPYILIVKFISLDRFLPNIISYAPVFLLLVPVTLLFIVYVKKYVKSLFYNKIKIYIFFLAIFHLFFLLVFDSWQLGYPRFIPIYVLIFLLLPTKFNFLSIRKSYRQMDTQFKRKTATVTFLTILLFQFTSVSLMYPMIKYYGFGITGCNAQLGRWISKYSNNNTSIAAGDIGALSFYSDVKVFDISNRSRTHPSILSDSQNPDLIFYNNITFLILKEPYKYFITHDERFQSKYDFICYAKMLSAKRIIPEEYVYSVFVLKSFNLPSAAKNELISSSYRFY